MSASKQSEVREGGAFRMRVSDALEVPRRGVMLRLKVIEGRPAMKDLKVGRRLQLSGGGGERTVRILGHATISGRATQERLDRTRELDVVIPLDEAMVGDARIEIGWQASGPVTDGSG